jgi:hypothetical protein
MRTNLKRLMSLAACLCALGIAQTAVGTTGAEAFEWAHHHEITSGANVFGGVELLSYNEVFPAGSGVTCAGIRGIGLGCPPGKAEPWRISISEFNFFEPYAHNHSTFTSFFSAEIN